MPIPPKIKERLSKLHENEEEIEKWWMSPHSYFHGKTPKEITEQSGESPVLAYLDAVISGAYL
ncbi:MAG: hypothetical protein Q7S36_00585 [Candidatus Liptonbacteria bacterium]|nr:hypothetical protein [Candidatus Liptonbacteria bacterium]